MQDEIFADAPHAGEACTKDREARAVLCDDFCTVVARHLLGVGLRSERFPFGR